MDGVERVMVLGIFAVIVAILSIAAWGMTGDEAGLVNATDGGVSGQAQLITSEGKRPQQATEDTAGKTGTRAQRPNVQPGAEEAAADDFGRRLAGGRNAVRPVDPNGPLAGANGSGRSELPSLSSSTPVHPGLGRKPEVLDPPAGAADKPGAEGRDDPAAPGEGAAPMLPAQKPALIEYTVVAGDTMWSIVRRHFGDGDTKAQMQYVQQTNPGIDVEHILVGDKLKLPATPPQELVSKPVTQRAKAGTTLYTIRPGDSLGGIAAAKLGAEKRWREIYELNRATIADPSNIHAGMTILLPEK